MIQLKIRWKNKKKNSKIFIRIYDEIILIMSDWNNFYKNRLKKNSE